MRWRCPECHAHYDFPTPPPDGVAYCPQCWMPMEKAPVSLRERVLRADVVPNHLRGLAHMMSHNGRY